MLGWTEPPPPGLIFRTFLPLTKTTHGSHTDPSIVLYSRGPRRRTICIAAGWAALIRKCNSAVRSSVTHAKPTMVGDSAHEASSKLRIFCTKECILPAQCVVRIHASKPSRSQEVVELRCRKGFGTNDAESMKWAPRQRRFCAILGSAAPSWKASLCGRIGSVINCMQQGPIFRENLVSNVIQRLS